ncbi:unnamed protein product [Pneumocystis jirovecii]|uniref:AD domain-containing protein n=1 Tax=Pneumocystis jirovecii TaxID=42068 RepID=L0P7E6_PNEJI|nr:unnamed protein product [Pneumocystis jirovecii]
MENHTGTRKNQEIGTQNIGNISLESTIGLRVKVRTLLDEIQTGENPVYAYDATTNTLMLQKESKTPHMSPAAWDFKRHLKHCVHGWGGDSTKDQATLLRSQIHMKPVSLDVLPVREQASRKEHQAAVARKGVGVTQEAQNLFDSLSKTLPCRWEKQSIIVLDEVYIDPPYTVEACWTDSKDSKSYSRVCKVLEGERQRLDAVSHRGG